MEVFIFNQFNSFAVVCVCVLRRGEGGGEWRGVGGDGAVSY